MTIDLPVGMHEKKKRKGQPSPLLRYRHRYARQAKALCRHGATFMELGDFFEVSTSTVWTWAQKYEDFGKAVRTGAEFSDDRVQRSLYERAVGYTYDAVKIFGPTADNPDSTYAPYREHVPPDVRAAIFWLQSRRRDQWRNVQEISGPGGGPVQLITATMSLQEMANAYQSTLKIVETQQIEDKSETAD